MKRRFLSVFTVLLVATMLLSACSGSGNKKDEPKKTDTPAAATGPVKGGTMTIAVTQDGTFLNPILNQDTHSGYIMGYIYDRLLDLDDKGNYIPWLAKGMPKSEDGGKKLTFELRNDVKFHDGKPLTAKDVRFTFEAIVHPGYTGNRQSGLVYLKGVDALRKAYKANNTDAKDKKITQEEADKKNLELFEKWKKEGGAILTPNDTTVTFVLDQPYAPIVATLTARGILPEHLWADKVGAKMKEAELNRKPVGSGRYSFVEWKPQDRIVLKANDSWWGGRPNIDTLVFRQFSDQNTAFAALEKGEVDMLAKVPVEQLDHVKNDLKQIALYEYPMNKYRSLAFDLKNPLFTDKNVRYALAYAFDKEKLVKQLWNGHAITAWSHASAVRWDYNPNVMKFGLDKAKAEKLLDDAGWKKGADGVRVKDGKKFEFDLYFVSSYKEEAEAAQVIQAAWKEIGVSANLKGTEYNTLLDISDAGNPKRNQPPAYILGWSVGMNEPDSFSTWSCGGDFNDISYCNKEVEDLLVKGRLEMDQAKRKEIYSQVQAKLAEDQPYIWLWFPNEIVGLNKRVKGPIGPTPLGVDWNLEKWWIDPAAK
ncbi:MAG TPA: ABC transporter substrate-binding protein [Symbiobacteriaceae bacterium]|nr:ABC transporter substrate-binding protein [Symbiobacteriaceae bacterium]